MKKILIIIFALSWSLLTHAQKESKSSYLVSYTISPASTLPEVPVTYRSVIYTPLDPLPLEEEIAATFGVKDLDKREEMLLAARKAKIENAAAALTISGSKFRKAETAGKEDWLITLLTSDSKITFTNEKPMSELTLDDVVIKISYSAVLSVKDNAGKVLWEKVLADPQVEEPFTKAFFYSNPVYMAKVALNKNNPEKLKKLNDEMLANKSHLLFSNLLVRADKALANNYEEQAKSINVSLFSVKGKAYEELNVVKENIVEVSGKFHALSKKNRIPKEAVDQVMRDAIPVWEKYYAEHKTELEEQAAKGLLLNCALATTWIGDLEKAATYLAQVSEAQKSEANAEDMREASPTPMGATVILSFSQSAVNMRDLYEIFSAYKNRITIQ